MKFKKPENENYCATVVKIKNIFPLEKCDNIQGTTIFGNPIIIGKDTNIGDIGLYFPAETQLSDEYTKANNLYRHPEKNADITKQGYIEDNRRIRTMKMRGHKSCGLFMPVKSLNNFIDISTLNEGDSFDEIKGIPICNKYIIIRNEALPGSKQSRKRLKQSKLINNQFRFHVSTGQLGKNTHMFANNDIISITYKLHGTSVIISKLLCKKKINIFAKFLKLIGVDVVDTEYDNIYSSRRVIKNDDLNMANHFYDMDIWGIANDKLKEFLLDGMTIYAEVVGFLPNGKPIQSGYDYGCEANTSEVYVYRITYTNHAGDVFEFSAKQVQDWCKERGLKAVPELYYDKAYNILLDIEESETDFCENLLYSLRTIFLEKDCFMCKNKVPAEGIVVRKETNGIDAFKFKSFAFLERETKLLDKETEDIEEEN